MELTSNQFLILSLGTAAGLAISWLGLIFFVSKQEGALESLFKNGNLLRMLTVVFIISAAALLAVVNKLSAEVAAILSGIAGFVLGTMKSGAEKIENTSVATDSKKNES
ncbi:MAG: hypothetical protein DHS20C13_28170 [Thermodesulfobacteriota bacterium]|nr:MAG: hypothetical protein DHS20C13_28170 [Thermodesulfobacteriota bacterium]